MARRIAALLMAAALACATAARAQKPYTGPEAEGDGALFGAWTFDVTSLARTDTAIGPVTNSVSVCLKLGAKPADIPLMAQALQGRCVMQRLEVKADHLSMLMLCEDFDRRTNLTMHLEPRKDGSYAGPLDYTLTTADQGGDTFSSASDVVARRTGGC